MSLPFTLPRRFSARRLTRVLAAGMAIAIAGCGGSSNTTNIVLSGNIVGLTDAGLTLSNGISSIVIGGGTTTFTFPNRTPLGAAYVVQPTTLPAAQACTVTNGSGVATKDVNTVLVTCVPSHTLGGTITGLTSGNLAMVNGRYVVSPVAGAQSFVFPGRVGQGFAYGVTVLNQPLQQNCTVINGVGTMGVSDINSIQVNCI